MRTAAAMVQAPLAYEDVIEIEDTVLNINGHIANLDMLIDGYLNYFDNKVDSVYKISRKTINGS